MAGTGIPQPFTIAIPDAALDDLRHRLRTARRPDDFDNADWSFGIERGWPEQMAGYWADAYDWRAQEAAMSAGRHLNNSAIGLTAWIWQRHRDWSDCNGDLEAHLGRDFL